MTYHNFLVAKTIYEIIGKTQWGIFALTHEQRHFLRWRYYPELLQQ